MNISPSETNAPSVQAAGNTLPPLRVATAGSVDDGKSTLIGRLLLDSKALLVDQLEAVEHASRRRGLSHTDLALVTDGLRAEREQGITIDVAFRYFATKKRRFVLADAPGHVQYTRNMAVAASQSDVAIVLVDARHGVVEQTRRHLVVAQLLGVPSLIVAVNKIDQVGYAHDVFARVRDAVVAFLHELDRSHQRVGSGDPLSALTTLPISALHGDHVVDPSPRLGWFDGKPLLATLETLEIAEARESAGRLAVQWVIRPQSATHPDYRGYAGRIAEGTLRVGDTVDVHPAGQSAVITAITTPLGDVRQAQAGRSIVVQLDRDLDVARGDWLAVRNVGVGVPRVSDDISADLVWLGPNSLRPNTNYLLKHGTKIVPSRVVGSIVPYDIANGMCTNSVNTLQPNDIAQVNLRTASGVLVEGTSRASRGFLLIDPGTNDTVGAGLFRI